MKRIIKLKVPDISEIKQITLPLELQEQLKTKKLAIFDLDETLVHCEVRDPEKGQTILKVNLPTGGRAKVKTS